MVPGVSGGPIRGGGFQVCCDENTIKMARKPEKKQKENPVECSGEGKR